MLNSILHCGWKWIGLDLVLETQKHKTILTPE